MQVDLRKGTMNAERGTMNDPSMAAHPHSSFRIPRSSFVLDHYGLKCLSHILAAVNRIFQGFVD
jgi:hypothetical protein